MNCENCVYYVFDEDSGFYLCEQDLDEDEMRRFLKGDYPDCPYFRNNDEYEVVRKQN